jgi:hypothetical protein
MGPRCIVVLAVALAVALSGCGGSSKHRRHPPKASATPTAASLGFPDLATKNTTRIATSDPIAVAAATALAVFPSAAAGTHPTAVVLAPTNDWEAAIASASLMAAPFRAPLLLSTPHSLPRATAQALNLLAPTGATSLGGAQVVEIGDVPDVPDVPGAVADPADLRTVRLSGSGPFAPAAAIDAYEAKRSGSYAADVMIASADAPKYAMPAAGYAAESGDPVLFVTGGGVPAPTRAALRAHHHPHIYVLGPPSVISAAVVAELAHYGTVARIGATDPAANAVAFTEYRDPACAYGQACVHIPGSFGWAIRSPGHGYVLIDARETLDAAAASALCSSGSYGPELLVDDPNTLPESVLNYFLNFATPGYTGEGPTAAVYNHAWLIGATQEISLAVQSEVDSLLEAVPQQ